MDSHYAATAQWKGPFDEGALQQWAEETRARLDADHVSLGLLFIAPALFEHAEQILEIVRVHARVPLLAGCSSGGLIAGAKEEQDHPGLALALYQLPGAQLTSYHFTQEEIESASEPGFWPRQTGVSPGQCHGWLLFCDPFHADLETWLRQWNEAFPEIPCVGGLADGPPNQGRTQLYLDGRVYEEGGIAIGFRGSVGLHGIVSQGCIPIGQTWTITKADRHFIHEIGNRPAYEVLMETFNQLPPKEQLKSRGNLFIGLVVNEYLEDFQRGDFLVRNLIGADPNSGSLAVGALPRAGQTIQFQRRDAEAATEDLQLMLGKARHEIDPAALYGACLFTCNGRGQHLFGAAHHDAGMIQEMLGPVGLAGFFCNGEIGPIGSRNFLHGYTASLALFVKK